MNRRGLAIILFAWIGATAGAGEAGGGGSLASATVVLSAQPDSAATLLLQGKVAIRRGDYATAMDALERGVALAPQESDYHHWLGNACAWAASVATLADKPALGKKCLAAYRRALELDPGNLPARLSLMNFYRHVPRLLGGGMSRARAEAEEIRRRDLVQGAYALAVLQAQEKDYAAAFATLAEVRRQSPAHYAALVLTGRVAIASGERLSEGEAALRRCLELAPAETDESHEAVARCLGELNALKPASETVARLK